MLRIALSIAVLLLGVAATHAQLATTSQIAAVKQTSLQKVDVPAGNYQVVLDMMDIAAGGTPIPGRPWSISWRAASRF
jgi:hypothetical protein